MNALILLLACAPTAPKDSAPDSAPPAVSCPPAEPWGLDAGERALDVEFTDCAGEVASLHGLCGGPALIVNWYGWCPSCEENAELARSLADELPGLAVAVVLEDDPLAESPEPEYCAAYEESRPSAARVWLDPTGALERYGETDLVLVLEADGTIGFVDQTSDEATIRAAVEAARR